MKETKSGLLEERKYRIACISAVIVLVVIVTVIFACFSRKDTKRKAAGAKNVVAVIGYDEAYALLCQLESTSYETQTVNQFDETIADHFKDKKSTFADAMNSVMQEIKQDDPAYDFIMETLRASMNEMDSECKIPYITCTSVTKYTDYSGAEGILKLTARVEYSIVDSNRMTVQERDGQLATYTTKVKQYVNQMLLNNKSESEIKDEVENEMKTWSFTYSNDNIRIKAYVDEIELK